MDFSKLTRDRKYITSKLQQLPNHSLVTAEDCYVVFPEKYIAKQLAYLQGRDKSILGICAIVMGDRYCPMILPNMIKVKPEDTSRFELNEVEYVALEYSKGAAIFESMNVIMSDLLVAVIYDTYIDSGLDAFFLNYEDRLKMFDATGLYAGITLGANHAVMRFIIAKILRNPKDKMKLAKESLNTQAKVSALSYEVVPFNSVIYGPKTTTGKLSGARADVGVNSALVSPSEKSDDIEKLLRL